MSTDTLLKCARRPRGNIGTQRHRDLEGRYCMSCVRRINWACGVDVVSLVGQADATAEDGPGE